MKYLILLLTCIPLYSFGQNPPVKVYNRIDSLTTTEQVQELVNQVLADSFHIVTNWLKADLTGDGRTDLLLMVESSYSHLQNLLSIINSGQDKFFVRSLNSRMSSKLARLTFPKVQQIDGHIVIIRESKTNSWDTTKPKIQIDTLWFNGDAFIEYNQYPKHYKIKEIEFSTTHCLGSCPVFNLEISSKRKAKLDESARDNIIPTEGHNNIKPRNGRYSAKINRTRYKAIVDILNYIDFVNLQNDYGYGPLFATDLPSFTLTIVYDNHKTKNISDYGQQGTLALRQVYQLLFELRKTLHWKRLLSSK